MNWIEADWPAPGCIKAGTTLRQGGVSVAPYNSNNLAMHVGDDPGAVMANRKQLAIPAEPQWLEQVHSCTAVRLPAKEKTPVADASYTSVKGVICTVMTADCLPLLITDRLGKHVAAIHAGWRGLCDGIIEACINKLPADNADLMVWLGPAIGADVYEVGQDVYDAFTSDDSLAENAFTRRDEQHWLLDMYQMARYRLNKLGIKHIYGGNHCTYTEEELFFSYRRDGTTGRMASMIWIDS